MQVEERYLEYKFGRFSLIEKKSNSDVAYVMILLFGVSLFSFSRYCYVYSCRICDRKVEVFEFF